MIYRFDVGGGAAKLVDELGGLAELGIQTAIGAVTDVSTITPLEIMGADVIPAVSAL